jgi:hypothetical protein
MPDARVGVSDTSMFPNEKLVLDPWRTEAVASLIYRFAPDDDDNSNYVSSSINDVTLNSSDPSLSRFVANNFDEMSIKTFWILIPFIVFSISREEDKCNALDTLEALSFAKALYGDDSVTSTQRSSIIRRFSPEMVVLLFQQLNGLSALFDKIENRSIEGLYTMCSLYRHLAPWSANHQQGEPPEASERLDVKDESPRTEL